MIPNHEWRQINRSLAKIVDRMSYDQAKKIKNSIAIIMWRRRNKFIKNIDAGDDQEFCDNQKNFF